MAKYTKRSDGRYYTLVDIGYSVDGKRKRKGFYAPTIRELEAKSADFRSQMNKGIIITDSRVTLADYATKWLDVYRSGGEYNTRTQYRLCVENHIVPHPVAQLPMIKIKPIDLQGMVNDLIAEKHFRTAQILVMTLKQIFAQAVEDSVIYANPASSLKRPTYKAPKKRPLSEIENRAIDNAELTGRERAFIYLGKYAGLRRGEILALTKNDFDWKKNTVTVNKAVVFEENNGVVKPMPKSDAGFRTIEMPDVLASFIKDYLQNLASVSLFLTEDGLVCTKSCYRKLWVQIIKKLNAAVGSKDNLMLIPDLTAHILRHDYATNLYYAGIDIKAAQYLLGHSDIKMTLEIYTHLDRENTSVSEKLNKHYGSQMVVKAE